MVQDPYGADLYGMYVQYVPYKATTALRGLLGLANLFLGFVPFHSDMVRPLQKMADPKAAKKSQIVWTPEGIKAFIDTKVDIFRCPLMHFLDDVLPIKLYTDASDYEISGILFQIVSNTWKPIAFVSKSLSSTQINWSTVQYNKLVRITLHNKSLSFKPK